MQENILKLIEELNKTHKFKVTYKEDSLLMKVISFILFFNRSFMTNFVTTIGSTIYLPKNMEKLKESTLVEIICHEFTHIDDNIKTGWFYNIKYLYPQVFAIFSLLGFLGFLEPSLFWLFGLAILALPISSPGRKEIEIKGYKTSLYVFHKFYRFNENYEEIKQQYLDYVNSVFIGPGYYFMWPFGVKEIMSNHLKDLEQGKSKEEIYKIIDEAILKTYML